jgi:NADH dehydrogenase
MKVFVTGGTGFVGQEVVRQLHEAGQAIRLLTRNPKAESAQAVASRYGAEVHAGNILDAASLGGALDGVAAVVHLTGIITEVGASTFEHVHIEGTRNVLAAAKQAGVRRWVHMSALGTRPNAASRYHQSKWEAEEIVRRSDMEFTIFRPSLIYGPGDEFVRLFARIIRLSPVVPVMGSPSARFQPVPVEAVAAAFAGALGEPRSIGQTYDLCGPDAMTLPEILDHIQAVLHRKRWKLQVPLGLARCQAAFLEFVCARLLGKAPPLNRDQLTMLQEDNVGNPQPANELFGLRPPKFQEGIAKYLGRGR